MPDPPRAESYDSVLREAARGLSETLASYGVLTRADLVARSGAERWTSVDFHPALECAIDLGLIREVDDNLYESLMTRTDDGWTWRES
ncbi:MAG TPA: hypothetical protein VMD09_10385 [Solirubrobacteraceae bacterium]|nr:hypothetical protein [Solirubrobacteraceae bacterium]